MVVIALLSVFAAVAVAASPVVANVRVQPGGPDGPLLVDATCARVPLVGWNAWEFVESAARGDGKLATALSQARDAGFNVVRVFGHSSGGHDAPPLQTSPGVYDDRVARSLDAVVAAAGRAGLRVVLTFGTMWKPADGKRQYVEWAQAGRCALSACPALLSSRYGGVGGYGDVEEDACLKEQCPDEDLFFTDGTARALYRNHIAWMLNRINTVSGVRYSDDPTILAWDLLNEESCDGSVCCAAVVVRALLSAAIHSSSLPSLPLHRPVSPKTCTEPTLRASRPPRPSTHGRARCRNTSNAWPHWPSWPLGPRASSRGVRPRQGRWSRARSIAVRSWRPIRCPSRARGGDPDDRNWASKQGGDFLSNNAHPGVDLAVFHLWRDGRTEKVV